MSPDGSGTHADPVRAVRFGRSVLGSVFRTIREGGRMPPMSCMEERVGRAFGEKTFGTRDPPENGLPCRNFTVRRVVSRLPARSVSGCRRSLPLPGSSRRSGPRRSVPYAGGGELLLSGCQRRLRTVFPAEKRAFRGLNERRVPEHTGVSPYYFSKSAVRSISSNVIGRISQSRCLASARRRPSGPLFSCRASARRSGGAVRCRSRRAAPSARIRSARGHPLPP